MANLFGSVSVSRQSLQNMQLGISVTGHNMANATTEGFTRQRVVLQSEKIFDGRFILGTGAEAKEIQRVHDALLERRIQNHKSDQSMLESEKDVLDLVEASMGQVIDRQSLTAEGKAASQGVGSPNGIAEFLDEFFTSLSAMTLEPTSSALRSQLVNAADSLATRFRNNHNVIEQTRESVLQQIDATIIEANQLIQEISNLNHFIAIDERKSTSQSNDLRDRRQLNIEKLAELVNIETTQLENGMIDVSVGGEILTGNPEAKDQIESYLDGSGNIQFRTVNGQADLRVEGGKLAGLAHARDNSLPVLRDQFDTLAMELISKVNDVYQSGFDVNGDTGKMLFTGTGAGDIGVDADLIADPGLFQASGDGTAGNNNIILNLIDLGNARHDELQGKTFHSYYADTIGSLGRSIRGLETAIVDNETVGHMLDEQRNSVSGVSLDEEMTNLIQYQRAYQASARVINILDQMIQTAIGLGA